MRKSLLQSMLFFLRWQLYPLFLALPAHLIFILRGLGESRCNFIERLKLAMHSSIIHLSVECGHNPQEILKVMDEIIELNPSIPGEIIECGVFLGGSTAKLSHAARFSGRNLIVCDSFEGLPEVSQADLGSEKLDFLQGAYYGSLPVVKENVRRFGRLEGVDFHPGWYENSLGELGDIQVACAFWDVDLQASFRACLLGLWKQIIPGSKVFIHDVDRDSVVEVFTDRDWWQENLGEQPPMLVGAHQGLGWGSPLLGFLIKDQMPERVRLPVKNTV